MSLSILQYTCKSFHLPSSNKFSFSCFQYAVFGRWEHITAVVSFDNFIEPGEETYSKAGTCLRQWATAILAYPVILLVVLFLQIKKKLHLLHSFYIFNKIQSSMKLLRAKAFYIMTWPYYASMKCLKFKMLIRNKLDTSFVGFAMWVYQRVEEI